MPSFSISNEGSHDHRLHHPDHRSSPKPVLASANQGAGLPKKGPQALPEQVSKPTPFSPRSSLSGHSEHQHTITAPDRIGVTLIGFFKKRPNVSEAVAMARSCLVPAPPRRSADSFQARWGSYEAPRADCSTRPLRLLALSRASSGLRKADWRWGDQVPSEEPSFFGVNRSIPPLDDPFLAFSFNSSRRTPCLVDFTTFFLLTSCEGPACPLFPEAVHLFSGPSVLA
jgi:hypothetical protein